MNPPLAARYRLRAYVCEDGCVTWTHHEGTMEFDEIYRRNPNGCRYAVAEAGRGAILLFDLWEAEQNPTPPPYFLPTGTRMFDDVNAAVAAACLLY